MKHLAQARAVARIKKKLRAAPCVPNKELLALSGAAKTLIGSLKDGDTQHNGLRFQLGALLLEGQKAAKSDGHYLAWCGSLGLQPRTAQNYSRMARAFGDCRGPFCDLKTTTIYRLAAATEEIQAKAMEAARAGALSPAQVATLLKPAKKPAAAPSTELQRVATIFNGLKPRLRAELVELLPAINLKQLLVALSGAKQLMKSSSEEPAHARGHATPDREAISGRTAGEPTPMELYILSPGESAKLPA